MKRRRGNERKELVSKKRKEPKWKLESKEIDSIQTQYGDMSHNNFEKFTDIPLSNRTQEGLRDNGYSCPTDIQKVSIPVALVGNDILGAAKTGSGKTLAFLIPVLELLWRERWSHLDGLGALVISPTRELAYQTFEVLRKVGSHHDFSAGLVIGGKDLTFEQTRLSNTNIIVCTPGRLLQHMDETPNFECHSLKILVLDEADRILDLGFRQTMSSVISNLPEDRQTLLFSATQTKSVNDLALLSLTDPEYISVHQDSVSSTPQKLAQSYVICNLQDKISSLYSFIKNHLSLKSIVFMSSCKQVRFIYEAFRRLRPGVPLMLLYGRQNQIKRMAVYEDFCRKKAAVLLCTDIAARGLDFPSVDWVIQLDCPEDTNTYIHRVGRTARYEKDGHALLFVLPSEIEIIKYLKEKKIPIDEIKIDPKRLIYIQGKLEAFCVQDISFKQLAQKSFIRYLRSIHLQSNKSIFNVRKLPTSEYALSLGLSQAPRIRFLKKIGNQDEKNWKGKEETEEEEKEGKEEEKEEKEEEEGDECSLLIEKHEKKKKFPTISFDDDILTVKSVIMYRENEDNKTNITTDSSLLPVVPSKPKQVRSKAKLVRSLKNKNVKVNTHIKFGEEENDESFIEKGEEDNEYEGGGINIEEAMKEMKKQDELDRKVERKRIRDAHLKRKIKKKKREERDSAGSGVVAVLGDEGSEQSEESENETELKRQKFDDDDDEEIRISEDEDLALHLLRTKR